MADVPWMMDPLPMSQKDEVVVVEAKKDVVDIEKEVIEAEQVVPEAIPYGPEAGTSTTVHPAQLPTALPQHLIMGDPMSSRETLLSHLTVIQQLTLPQDLASGILIQQEFYKHTLQQQILLSMITNSKLLDQPSTTVKIAQRVEAPAKGMQLPDLGMILASPTDVTYLNPIHCSVCCHVEFFIADKEDVATPSPGWKTCILLGQVGICCVHCTKMPLKKWVETSLLLLTVCEQNLPCCIQYEVQSLLQV